MSKTISIIVSAVSGLIGTILGIYIIKMLGTGFIPVALMFILGYLIIVKGLKIKRSKLTTALTIQTGYTLWLTFSFILSFSFHFSAYGILLDLVVLYTGLIWIIIKESTIPFIILIAYHVIGFITNLTSLSSAIQNGTPGYTLLHIVIRILSIIFMLMYLANRSSEKNNEQTIDKSI